IAAASSSRVGGPAPQVNPIPKSIAAIATQHAEYLLWIIARPQPDSTADDARLSPSNFVRFGLVSKSGCWRPLLAMGGCSPALPRGGGDVGPQRSWRHARLQGTGLRRLGEQVTVSHVRRTRWSAPSAGARPGVPRLSRQHGGRGPARRARSVSTSEPAPDHPDALTAASTISASFVSPTLRPHADSALNSLASSGPTRFALSFLALFSAPMMFSDRAGPASLGSGLGARRLRTLDAAPRVVVAWSRIRAIVSCGRITITTP